MSSHRKRSAIQRHRLNQQHAETMRNIAEAQVKVMTAFAEEAARRHDELKLRHEQAEHLLNEAYNALLWYYEMHADSDISQLLEKLDKHLNPL